MSQCEECGITDVPLVAIVFSLKNKDKPDVLYTDSVYLCERCLNQDEKSRTIH